MPSLIAKVGIAMLIPPEDVRAPVPRHPSRTGSIEDPPQAPGDAGTSGCLPVTCFKNPLLLIHGYPARHLQHCGPAHNILQFIADAPASQ